MHILMSYFQLLCIFNMTRSSSAHEKRVDAGLNLDQTLLQPRLSGTFVLPASIKVIGKCYF